MSRDEREESRERTTKYEGVELVQLYGFFRIYLTEHGALSFLSFRSFTDFYFLHLYLSVFLAIVLLLVFKLLFRNSYFTGK